MPQATGYQTALLLHGSTNLKSAELFQNQAEVCPRSIHDGRNLDSPAGCLPKLAGHLPGHAGARNHQVFAEIKSTQQT